MKKYLAVASNSIKSNLAYRANNFIMVFSVFFNFAILFYFWGSVYRQGNQIGSYTMQEIISYYFFTMLFELLVTSDGTAWSIGNTIKNGQISNLALKPINFINYKLAQSLGGIFYRSSLFSLPIILVIYVMKNYLVFFHGSIIFLGIMASFLLSYLLNFLIYFSIGMLGFWTGNPHSFFFTCLVVISFMQGQWFPLDLLPHWFLTISNYFPFQYLFFMPISLATNRIIFNLHLLLIPFGWCLVFYLLGSVLYKKGLKKYEGYGI